VYSLHRGGLCDQFGRIAIRMMIESSPIVVLSNESEAESFESPVKIINSPKYK